MTKEKKQAEIRVSKLSRRYYIGVGCCRLKSEFNTFVGAVKSAERKGYTVVNKDIDPKVGFLKNDKKTKIVTNLRSGKLVRIPVNTPACSDPSTETYWSM